MGNIFIPVYENLWTMWGHKVKVVFQHYLKNYNRHQC